MKCDVNLEIYTPSEHWPGAHCMSVPFWSYSHSVALAIDEVYGTSWFSKQQLPAQEAVRSSGLSILILVCARVGYVENWNTCTGSVTHPDQDAHYPRWPGTIISLMLNDACLQRHLFLFITRSALSNQYAAHILTEKKYIARKRWSTNGPEDSSLRLQQASCRIDRSTDSDDPRHFIQDGRYLLLRFFKFQLILAQVMSGASTMKLFSKFERKIPFVLPSTLGMKQNQIH